MDKELSHYLHSLFQTTLNSDFKCNTSVPVVGTDSRIKHLAFRSQVFYSWPVVQLILDPAYLPIADVSEIGLFGEILSDESVGVLIQPFLPRMVRTAKIGLRLQCFGYFGVLVELFAVIHGDGVDPVFMCL